MYGVAGAPPAAVKKGNKKLARLLAEDSADEEMDVPSTSATPSPDSDTNKPWLHEFKQYIDGVDEVPNRMTITKWWGGKSIHQHLNYFSTDILPEINSSRFLCGRLLQKIIFLSWVHQYLVRGPSLQQELRLANTATD